MSHRSDDFAINRYQNKGESRDFIRKGSASVYNTGAERSLGITVFKLVSMSISRLISFVFFEKYEVKNDTKIVKIFKSILIYCG